jgi:phosphomannomutase
VLKSYNQDQFIKQRLDELLNEKEYVVFGSEGLCGGPVFPNFNNVRDGFFISAKLIEILVNSGKKLSTLISKLPKFYSYQEKIPILKQKLESFIKGLYKELSKEGETVNKVGNNLRFGHKKDWFVLIYPSNYYIKVYSEAKRDSLARLYCETATELIKMVISKT